MRNANYTLTLNLPNDHVLEAMYPISRGPYMGHDILMLMNDLCGRCYVVRATLTGEHLYTSEKLGGRQAAEELVNKLILTQSTRDCDAVTGGGRWSCD